MRFDLIWANSNFCLCSVGPNMTEDPHIHVKERWSEAILLACQGAQGALVPHRATLTERLSGVCYDSK